MSLPVYETLIRESDLDTFGHVNNSVYLKLFEEARWDIVTAGGYGLKEILAKRQGPIVLEVNVKFRRELKLREVIQIHSKVLELQAKTWRMEQTILNSKGEVAAVAEFSMGFFDLVARKLIPLSGDWLRAMGEITA